MEKDKLKWYQCFKCNITFIVFGTNIIPDCPECYEQMENEASSCKDNDNG